MVAKYSCLWNIFPLPSRASRQLIFHGRTNNRIRTRTNLFAPQLVACEIDNARCTLICPLSILSDGRSFPFFPLFLSLSPPFPSLDPCSSWGRPDSSIKPINPRQSMVARCSHWDPSIDHSVSLCSLSLFPRSVALFPSPPPAHFYSSISSVLRIYLTSG